MGDGRRGQDLGKLAAGFHRENPEAKVRVTPVPWDGAHSKIANAIAAGQTPDVSLVGTTWMGEFAGAVVVVVPVLLLFGALQRHFTQGIATTGFK